jgi:5-methylcytosine-specific restriction endonuclease McrA
MSRREFPRKVRAAALLRANDSCECCGAPVKPPKLHYDHILPDALGGEPTLANCQVVCVPCHREKTTDDVRRVRKADRVRDRHTGALTSKHPIKSRGFAKAAPQSRATAPLTKALPPRRPIYERTEG